ncbi:MAG: undecaprenyldiphospho-muramoylpentapeptide beta-N-acetylglucosaminyltransferase [Bacteroidota bacterium]
MKNGKPYRLIISGGGTGGHIFPALAIANAFKERHPDAEILFVGAKGKMEMTRVPEAGYRIVGLWISGLQRKLTWANFLFPLKLIASYFKAQRIVKKFKPNAVVGTGGYASGPIMLAATKNKIPAIIQEQNSYAGLTNKQVAEKAQRICVAYAGMEKYFPKEKVVLTGNPVRKDILNLDTKREQALNQYGFSASHRTLLVLGGSLGARTINTSLVEGINKLIDAGVQVVWQTGRGYYDQVKESVASKDLRKVRIYDFVKRMDMAYAAADVVVARAGALSISELCLAKKPAILVPSPNVAEDHQTKNAMALVKENAAILVKDADAQEQLVNEALALLFDEARCKRLSENIAKMGRPNAATDIVQEIEKLIA